MVKHEEKHKNKWSCLVWGKANKNKNKWSCLVLCNELHVPLSWFLLSGFGTKCLYKFSTIVAKRQFLVIFFLYGGRILYTSHYGSCTETSCIKIWTIKQDLNHLIFKLVKKSWRTTSWKEELTWRQFSGKHKSPIDNANFTFLSLLNQMRCDLLSGTPTYRYVTLTSNVTSNVGLFKNPISKIWVATMMLGCVVQSYASFSKVKRKNNTHQFKFGLGGRRFEWHRTT